MMRWDGASHMRHLVDDGATTGVKTRTACGRMLAPIGADGNQDRCRTCEAFARNNPQALKDGQP